MAAIFASSVRGEYLSLSRELTLQGAPTEKQLAEASDESFVSVQQRQVGSLADELGF